MNHYAGIDVSLEYASVCVIDASGKIVGEGKVLSEPQALLALFAALGIPLTRIGLDAGPLSQWLYPGFGEAGLAVEALGARDRAHRVSARAGETAPQGRAGPSGRVGARVGGPG